MILCSQNYFKLIFVKVCHVSLLVVFRSDFKIKNSNKDLHFFLFACIQSRIQCLIDQFICFFNTNFNSISSVPKHIENPRQLVWHSVRQFRKTVWLNKNLKCHHIFRNAIKISFICLTCLLQEYIFRYSVISWHSQYLFKIKKLILEIITFIFIIINVFVNFFLGFVVKEIVSRR